MNIQRCVRSLFKNRALVFTLGVCSQVLSFGAQANLASAQSALQGFPHAKHEKLFPQCSGCHAGIPTGTLPTSFPDTALCGQCHNNRDQKKVLWSARHAPATNLRFSHVEHMSKAGASVSTCASCHATPDGKWMGIERATPAQCQSCHTHQATSHYAADSRCATCHVTLSQAKSLSVARIVALPKPPSHSAPDFQQNHKTSVPAAQAQCAFCHAKESCARCHVNATRVTNQFNLVSDTRVATAVAGKAAVYAVPASHRSVAFVDTHGEAARTSVQTCANCHARSSCQTCHTGTGAERILALMPNAEKEGAQGVQLKSSVIPWNSASAASASSLQLALGPATQPAKKTYDAPGKNVRVHAAGFARSHGAPAAAGQQNCEGCHARSYCAECHAGEGKRRFHVANFAVRHAPEAWSRETDCAQCHNTEVFCRGCHLQVGLSSKGRSNVGFHSAIALWPLQHGQAARQSLQTCTSCHTQKDCMQCHSQAGRRINPHGADFDAKRMWKANRLTCLRCHFKDPFGAR